MFLTQSFEKGNGHDTKKLLESLECIKNEPSLDRKKRLLNLFIRLCKDNKDMVREMINKIITINIESIDDNIVRKQIEDLLEKYEKDEAESVFINYQISKVGATVEHTLNGVRKLIF